MKIKLVVARHTIGGQEWKEYSRDYYTVIGICGVG